MRLFYVCLGILACLVLMRLGHTEWTRHEIAIVAFVLGICCAAVPLLMPTRRKPKQ